MNSSIEKNSSNDPKDAMRMSKTNPLSNSIEVATNVIPKPSEADEYYDEEAWFILHYSKIYDFIKIFTLS